MKYEHILNNRYTLLKTTCEIDIQWFNDKHNFTQMKSRDKKTRTGIKQVYLLEYLNR